MLKLVLYTAPACHLCDLAKELVWPLLEARGGELEEVDITQSDRLMERYGTRIPVLALTRIVDEPVEGGGNGTGEAGTRELGWPFEAMDVIELLTRQK